LRERAALYDVQPWKATYEEFLELSENSEERYEYIDGEIYLLASPKTLHQKILGDLYFAFLHWFQGKNCRPMLAPYDITLKEIRRTSMWSSLSDGDLRPGREAG
jgi:hypothetical protein